MINLIPPTQKEEIKRDQIFKVCCHLFLFVSFFLIFLTLDLKILSVALFEEKEILKRNVTLGAQTEKLNKNIFEKMSLGEKASAEILNFQKQKKDVFPILVSLFQTFPQGVTFKSISLDEDLFLISGKAKDRQNLLEFKKNLEKQKMFSDVEFSPESWLPREDIDFLVKFKIKWSSEKK